MKKILCAIAVLGLAGSTLWACAGASPPATSEKTVPAAGASASKPAWEEKWNATLDAARKEGTVTVYTVWRPEARAVLTPLFKEKYGITLEFTPFSRGADLLPKVQTEQRAGMYLADVFGAGNPTLIATMKPAGVLGSLKPLLILPEVLDPKAWRAGAIPFTDTDSMALGMRSVVLRQIVYNSDLVKDSEITSPQDLFKPQFKGKIALNDPSVPGAGNAIITHLDANWWGEAGVVTFLQRLVKEQNVDIQRDNRIVMESVARGKYSIAIAPVTDEVSHFLSLNAPIKIADLQEDNYVTPEAGALGVPTSSAHPNAAIVFVNWLLTKEGQSAFIKGFPGPGTRADVSVDGLGINPRFVPTPGKKYYTETEDWLKTSAKWLGLARKTIDEAAK